MIIRPASKQEAHAIAELALIAGEGIPAFFWEQAQRPGETLIEVGARNLLSGDENFSYRNVQVALVDDTVAGMMLAYRLPPAQQAADPSGYPAFIRPLIELENLVPQSYYVNMLAAYPQFRGQGVGTALMGQVDRLASQAGATCSSLQVFDGNHGALRLYQRLGYQVIDTRPVIPHPSHPYRGKVLLMTREVA